MQIIHILLFLLLLLNGKPASSQSLTLVCDNYPPYQTVKNDTVDGYSTRIVRIILKEMEAEIKRLDVLPWKRALNAMETSKADALFSANYTEERAAYAYYPSEPLVQSPWVIWVREEDGIQYDSFSDLDDGIVGVVRGYSYTPEFWKYLKKGHNYEEVTDDDTNFRKLHGGRIKYIIAELGNGLQIISELKLKGIIPLTAQPVKTDGLYITFNKKTVQKSFVDDFSRRLTAFRGTDTYQKIYQSYFKH